MMLCLDMEDSDKKQPIEDGQLLTRARFSAASAVRGRIRLRMSKKRAETRTINVKQTIEKRMSPTIEQNG
jgi:hypothetical protein